MSSPTPMSRAQASSPARANGRNSPSYAEVLSSPRTPTPSGTKAARSQVQQQASARGRPSLPGANASTSVQVSGRVREIALALSERAAEIELAAAGGHPVEQVNPAPGSATPAAAANTPAPGPATVREAAEVPLIPSSFFSSPEQSEDGRYPTPDIEDWRNLSVHGTGSISSETTRELVGESCADGCQLEDIVTDKIDRYGKPLPGYEQMRAHEEEWRAHKRQRCDPSPSPKRMVVRFWKYLDGPAPTMAQRVAKRKAAALKAKAEYDALPSPVFRSACLIQCETRAEGRAELFADIRRLRAQISPRGEPAPHLLDEDYADPEKYPRRGPMPRTVRMDVDGPESPATQAGPSCGTASRDAGLAREQSARRSAPEVFPRAVEETTTAPSRFASAKAGGLSEVAAGKARAVATQVFPHPIPSREETLRPSTPAAARRESLGGAGPYTSAARPWANIPNTPAHNNRQGTPAASAPGASMYTPAPPEGFPVIHDAQPESLIECLDPERVAELWKKDKDSVILVHPHNVGFPKPGQSRPILEEITAVIRHKTGEEKFKVIPPVAPLSLAVVPRGNPAWGVTGLTRRSNLDLISAGTLSTERVTLEMRERALYIPTYLLTTQGYSHNVDDDISTCIVVAFSSGPIYDSIVDLVSGNANYNHLAPADAAELILSSLRVRVDTLGNDNLQAAIFMDTPTSDADSWRHWRHWLMTLPYRSLTNTTGYARPIESCDGCHSADHVTHMCPFPAIPGWNAPPASSGAYGRHQLGTNTHAPAGQANQQAPWTGQPNWHSADTSRGGRGRGGYASRGGRGRGRGFPAPPPYGPPF
ncbi:hypothetical protein VTO73DRAFT_4508 [Trametes versicolor]